MSAKDDCHTLQKRHGIRMPEDTSTFVLRLLILNKGLIRQPVQIGALICVGVDARSRIHRPSLVIALAVTYPFV